MKIVLLTPGTGNFHCENCLHDHALANGLISAGHDAVVYPLYLPIVADTESPGPQRSLQMSGLNVYLQEKLPFYSNMPGWMKRVMSSRGLLELSARFAGMTSARELGELTLSMLSGSDGRQLAEIEALVDSVKASDHPDVIILSNVMLVGLAPALRSAFDVPVICSLQGEDVFLDSLEDPYRDQAWQVLREKCNFIDHFVAVSSYYNAAIYTWNSQTPELGTSRVPSIFSSVLFPEPDGPIIDILSAGQIASDTSLRTSRLDSSYRLHTSRNSIMGSVWVIAEGLIGSLIPGP